MFMIVVIVISALSSHSRKYLILKISPVSSVKRIFKIGTAINTISNSSMSVLTVVESVLIALNVRLTEGGSTWSGSYKKMEPCYSRK